MGLEPSQRHSGAKLGSPVSPARASSDPGEGFVSPSRSLIEASGSPGALLGPPLPPPWRLPWALQEPLEPPEDAPKAPLSHFGSPPSHLQGMAKHPTKVDIPN